MPFGMSLNLQLLPLRSTYYTYIQKCVYVCDSYTSKNCLRGSLWKRIQIKYIMQEFKIWQVGKEAEEISFSGLREQAMWDDYLKAWLFSLWFPTLRVAGGETIYGYGPSLQIYLSRNWKVF